MTLRSTESCGEKCLNQFPSKSVTDHEPTETDQVEIVVLNTLVGGKYFVNETRADAGNFVRGDRCPDSAATDRHATIYISAAHGASQGHDIIGIVVVELRMPVSEVNYFMTGGPQPVGDILFQLKAAVVGGNADEFRGACGNRL